MEKFEFILMIISLPVCYWLIVEFIDLCGRR